jgi:hypothetical protein
MGKCPYIGPSNWLTTGGGYRDFRCVTQKSFASVTKNLIFSYAVQFFLYMLCFPSVIISSFLYQFSFSLRF